VYVAVFNNNRIRRVAPDGTTITIAGDGRYGFSDGNGCGASFNGPIGLALLGKQLVVADLHGQRIRIVALP
jgi:hypothetical protein